MTPIKDAKYGAAGSMPGAAGSGQRPHRREQTVLGQVRLTGSSVLQGLREAPLPNPPPCEGHAQGRGPELPPAAPA